MLKSKMLCLHKQLMLRRERILNATICQSGFLINEQSVIFYHNANLGLIREVRCKSEKVLVKDLQFYFSQKMICSVKLVWNLTDNLKFSGYWIS